MTDSSLIAGIDICQSHLDVHLLPAAKDFRVRHESAGLRTLIRRLRSERAGVQCIAMEATGGLERGVAAALGAAGLPVVILNPRQVRDFARASGLLAKTDQLDAAVLAGFAQRMRPPVRPLPTADQHRLKDLVMRRSQLVAMATAERSRLHRCEDEALACGLRAHIDFLAEQKKATEARIGELVAHNPRWREREQILTSTPGVGPATAWALLAHMPELGDLNRHKAAALVGLAPMADDSGRHRGARHIQGGRHAARQALYMATLVALRHNSVLRRQYQNLRGRGKPAKVAIVACMRKLLVILNAMIKNHRAWAEGQNQD